MSHLGYFISILNLLIAIPLGMGIRTLLAMKQSVVVPLLRVRTVKGTNEPMTKRVTARTGILASTTSSYALKVGTAL